MNSYPPGLHARPDCFRVLKSVWTNECKDFVISRMKASLRNIKPVVVTDDTTKTAECYLINKPMTAFVLQTGMEADVLCRQAEQRANWFIERTVVQLSNKSIEQKEKEVTAIHKKYRM